MIRTKVLFIALLILVPSLGFAQDISKDFAKIMIRNVTVIDQAGESEDMVSGCFCSRARSS